MESASRVEILADTSFTLHIKKDISPSHAHSGYE